MDLSLKEHTVLPNILSLTRLGDPGVFANKTLAEADPHRLLRHAYRCFCCPVQKKATFTIRSEYPLGDSKLLHKGNWSKQKQ